MVRRNSKVTIFQRSAQGGEVGGRKWERVLAVVGVDCPVLFRAMESVLWRWRRCCCLCYGSGIESEIEIDRAEQEESSRLRHRTLCRHC
jgi:hypothetical protein